MSQYQVKSIIVGDAGVGKSSILVQFTDQRFRPTYRSTVGIDYGTRTLTIGTTSLKFQIWDTAGQEVFQSVIRSYYRNTTIAIVVYDITQPATFDRILKWFETVADYSQPDVMLVLVGNKRDLVARRKITTAQGATLAAKYDAMFYEVSATSIDDIDNLFRTCAIKILDRIRHGSLTVNFRNGITLIYRSTDKPYMVCCT